MPTILYRGTHPARDLGGLGNQPPMEMGSAISKKKSKAQHQQGQQSEQPAAAKTASSEQPAKTVSVTVQVQSDGGKEELEVLLQRFEMDKCALKFDHFENIHRLHSRFLAFEGAPNFRQVGQLPCFGTGQPTTHAFNKIVTHIKTLGISRLVWTSMRQEPVVYLNGLSFTPRDPARLSENMDFGSVSGKQMQLLTGHFVSVLRQRAEENENQVHYFRDTFAEHPEDRVDQKHIVPLESLHSLDGVYAELQANTGFEIISECLPIVDEKAPAFSDLDILVRLVLREDKPGTAFVFNCQMANDALSRVISLPHLYRLQRVWSHPVGKGRTTTGMICSCLVKEVLAGEADGRAAFVPESHPGDHDPYADETAAPELRAGNFAIIVALLDKLGHTPAAFAKAQLDRLIDMCGPPVGLQNLRECIIWTRKQFNKEPERKQPFWKHMARNFIERYYVLICFATYVNEAAPAFDTSFDGWMAARPALTDGLQQQLDQFNWA